MSAAAVAITRGQRWGWMLLLTQLAFWLHLVGDYFLSGWGVPVLWPVSKEEVLFYPRMGLDHPLNIALSYAGFAAMAGSLWIFGRTPMEFVWPKLDQLLTRMLSRRRLVCHLCGGKTGVVCETCGRPMCLRHGSVNARLATTCSQCRQGRVCLRGGVDAG